MWIWTQAEGFLMFRGNVVGQGYAGAGFGKNNPAAQWLHDIGPICRGFYTIESPVTTKTHGEYVLWLEPDASNVMEGRAGFGIHGDNRVHPGTASEGCIILPRTKRELIWTSGDHRLQVVDRQETALALEGITQ